MLHVPDTLHTGPYILQHAFGFLYQRKVTHISEYKPNYSDKNYHRHVNPYRIKHGLEPFEQSRVLGEETRKEAYIIKVIKPTMIVSLTRSINKVPKSLVNEILSYFVIMPQRHTSPTRGNTRFTA